MQRSETREVRFERLVADVYGPLQRYLGRRSRPADADEVLGDTLTVLWRRLDDVPTDDPLPWAYRVAGNCLANHRRGDARRLRLVDRLHAERPTPTAVGASAGGDDQLSAALAALGPDDRELVRLWAWEQLEPREIAVVLGTSPNAVSARLTRARRRLEQQLIRTDRDTDRGGPRQDAAVAGQEPGGHGKEHRS